MLTLFESTLTCFLFLFPTRISTQIQLGGPIGQPQPGQTAGTTSTISVAIEPKIPMTKCSGSSIEISCQLVDYEGELPKQMRKQRESTGYGGYVEFLLFKRTKAHTTVVSDIHVNYPQELLSPKKMVLNNLTIFDKGEYNCTILWHAITGDNAWFSPPLQLNVYDCVDLETEIIEAKQGDSVTMQCIDVEAPLRWFKDDDLLGEDDSAMVSARAKTPVPGVRVIAMRSVEDAGIYTCKGTFEDTQQIFTKLIKVMLKTAPTTPINIVPERLAPNTVVLTWHQRQTANDYIVATPTFYTIFYKPMDGDNFKSKTVLKKPEVMLTNLKANTVYFVRIQAENELGTSVSGSRIVVTPAASKVVSIDKRLMTIMQERVKILEQDLASIINVLEDVLDSEENENGEEDKDNSDEDDATF